MSFAGQPVDDQLLSKVSDRIGSIAQSMLDEAEFNQENPGTWVLMDGRNCSGSEYHTITGNTTVPNMLQDQGDFLRQAKPGRTKGTHENMDWKGFYQRNTGQNTYSYNHNDTWMGKSTSSFVGNMFAGHWAAPAAAVGTKWDTSEIRPQNTACNFFIKINY